MKDTFFHCILLRALKSDFKVENKHFLFNKPFLLHPLPHQIHANLNHTKTAELSSIKEHVPQIAYITQ